MRATFLSCFVLYNRLVIYTQLKEQKDLRTVTLRSEASLKYTDNAPTLEFFNKKQIL